MHAVSRTVASLFVVLTQLHTFVRAQVGVDICACQPGFYEFTLNFDFPRDPGENGDDNNCDPGEIAGPGIRNTSCLIDNLTNETDTSNTEVAFLSSISILELDQMLLPLVNVRFSGPFRDGDTFTYTSIIANGLDDMSDTSAVPAGFQINGQGRNGIEQDISINALIRYENDCGIFPLLEEGDQIGPYIFSDLGPPPVEICPLAPTRAPQSTRFPTMAPVVVVPPTASPVVENVDTEAPVALPTTDAPVPPPTTEAPTRAPAIRTTNRPTESPVEETESPVGKRATAAPESAAPVSVVPGSPTPAEPESAPEADPVPTCPGKSGKGGSGKRGSNLKGSTAGKKKSSSGTMSMSSKLKAPSDGKRFLNAYPRSLATGNGEVDIGSDDECPELEELSKKSTKSASMNSSEKLGKGKSGGSVKSSKTIVDSKKGSSTTTIVSDSSDGKRNASSTGKKKGSKLVKDSKSRV